jgi:hypothetical protein
MANQEIQIKLTAIDEASSVIDAASKKISADVDEVSNSQKKLWASVEGSLQPLAEDAKAQDLVGESAKKSDASIRSFTTGLSGVATASFSLYGAIDRVQESEISLDRANLMVKSSTKSVEDAHRSVSEAISKHGASSQEAKTAEEALSIAEDRLTLANEGAEQSQENVNKSIMSAALQIIPTSITMVDSLSRAWKNFPDMTGVLTTLGTNVSMVGNKALIASVSVAGFVGGFVLGYEAITQFGDALGPAGRALMVIVPAIIAAAAAVWMLMEGLTLGTATVALVTSGIAVGAMVANIGSYGNGLGQGVKVPAMAAGGIVDSPTLALVGEAGPEIVMPLSRYESQQKENIQKVTVTQATNQPNVFHIQVTQQFYGDINSPEYVDQAAEKTLEKLDEKLAHWR